jgi:hypothetical protein
MQPLFLSKFWIAPRTAFLFWRLIPKFFSHTRSKFRPSSAVVVYNIKQRAVLVYHARNADMQRCKIQQMSLPTIAAPQTCHSCKTSDALAVANVRCVCRQINVIPYWTANAARVLTLETSETMAKRLSAPLHQVVRFRLAVYLWNADT